jgi:prepilin-type processing-associated H-X9-DG protein
VDPYTKSEQIYQCPSKKRKVYALGTELQSQYGIPYHSSLSTELLCPTGYPLAKVQEPTRTMMVTESRQYNTTDGQGFYTPAFPNAPTSDEPEDSLGYFTADVHLEGYNVAFADGHVKWIKFGTGKNWIWRCPALPNRGYYNQGTAVDQCP